MVFVFVCNGQAVRINDHSRSKSTSVRCVPLFGIRTFHKTRSPRHPRGERADETLDTSIEAVASTLCRFLVDDNPGAPGDADNKPPETHPKSRSPTQPIDFDFCPMQSPRSGILESPDEAIPVSPPRTTCSRRTGAKADLRKDPECLSSLWPRNSWNVNPARDGASRTSARRGVSHLLSHENADSLRERNPLFPTPESRHGSSRTVERTHDPAETCQKHRP